MNPHVFNVIFAVLVILLAVSSLLTISRVRNNCEAHMRWLKTSHDRDLRAVAEHANTYAEERRPHPGTLAVTTLYPGFDSTIGGELDELPHAVPPEDIRRAPFTDEQIDSLNGYQTTSIFHAFTCGTDSAHGPLLARADGMVCQTEGCGYHQEWVHSFMADSTWSDTQQAVMRRIRVSGEDPA